MVQKRITNSIKASHDTTLKKPPLKSARESTILSHQRGHEQGHQRGRRHGHGHGRSRRRPGDRRGRGLGRRRRGELLRRRGGDEHGGGEEQHGGGDGAGSHRDRERPRGLDDLLVARSTDSALATSRGTVCMRARARALAWWGVVRLGQETRAVARVI